MLSNEYAPGRFQPGQTVSFSCIDRGSNGGEDVPHEELAKIVRQIGPDEADYDEVGPMYEIRMYDQTGERWKADWHAFEDELSPVETE
jgi:hypothetical protein